jgi:opacity protein-like surface antigen
MLASSVLAILSASSIARAQESGLYVSAFGGGNFLHQNDFDIRSSNPALTGFSTLPATMHFDPGGVVGGTVGYRWGSLAAEAELSGRRGMFEREDLPTGPIPLEGRYDAVSLMANVYYRFQNDMGFVPYLGTGAGVAFLSAKVSPPGSPTLELSDTRAAFQAIAGIAFPVTQSAEIGLEYRYFVTDRPIYSIDLGGVAGTANVGYNSSNVLLRLNWKFD